MTYYPRKYKSYEDFLKYRRDLYSKSVDNYTPMVKLTDEEKIDRKKILSRKSYIKKKLKENPNWKPYVKKTLEQQIEYRKDYYDKHKVLKGNRSILKDLSPEELKEYKSKQSRKKYVEKRLKENPDWKPRRPKTPEELKEYIRLYNKKLKEKRESKPGWKPRIILTPEERLNKSYYKPREKKYLNDKDLRKEIMISKENKKTTEKLKMMLYEMCVKINKRFKYFDEDMKYDIVMGSYVDVMIWYPQFNPKYPKSFPYITELIKRSQAYHFNLIINKGFKGFGNKYKKMDFVSSSEVFNL